VEILINSPFLDGRKKILENKVGFVVEDIYPVSKGHMLIIPHREYQDYFQSTLEEFTGLNELLIQAKNYVQEKFSPDGFNVGINCGENAGQTVMHMHIHLIPRYKNDVDDPRGGVRGVIPSKQKY
tara:strand:+ start:131 stop:505 length:375 start_codon:yes stop_codon:yes gene_type:complete